MSRMWTRRRWVLALLVFVAGLVVSPLTSRVGPVAAHQAGIVSIQIVDFSFDPLTIKVPVGTTVEWTNRGDAPHTVTADDGIFDSGNLGTGDTYSVTFDAPGTYAYHCEIHPRMKATIVVVAADEPTTPSDQPSDETPTPPPTAEDGTLPQVAVPHLAHIHAGGCDDLGIVVYPLHDPKAFRVPAEATDDVRHSELTEAIANVAIEDLFNEPFSIHVHESAADKQIYIACAEIPTRPADPWTPADGLALRLNEQAKSGHDGMVYLRPGAEGETVVTIALARAEAAATSETPPPPRGTTYTSPTFGYTITYPRAWTVTEDVSASGRDRFVLYNGTSYVTFTSAEGFGGDPQACVDDFVAVLTSDPNVSNLELATDAQGNPAKGGTEATGAYAIYNHDYTFTDRVEAYTLYVACVPLVKGQSVLAVVQNVPTVDFNDQVAAREGLLRGVTLAQ